MSSMVGSVSGSNYNNIQGDSYKDQLKQDMKTISSALQSGDMVAAQDAFGKLQELQKQRGSKHAGNGTLQTDMKSLEAALSSGNLQDAQSAFVQLQTDMKSHGGHHAQQSSDAMQSISMQTDARSGASPARYA